jgi:hypothetical protein
MRRSTIWPLRNRPYNNSSSSTASSPGKELCVLVRRRNSWLMRSSALVVRSAFHCNCGNCKKVNSSSPASSSEQTTALQRSALMRTRQKLGAGTSPMGAYVNFRSEHPWLSARLARLVFPVDLKYGTPRGLVSLVTLISMTRESPHFLHEGTLPIGS